MMQGSHIAICENEIVELGNKLCETLVTLTQRYPHFLSSVQSEFSINRYLEAIDSLEWYFEQSNTLAPEITISLFGELKNKVHKVLHLYELERQNDEGYKDPVTHMNAIMEAGEKIPNHFGKRYGLKHGDVKALWLTTPVFVERLLRKRIGEAVARNGSRTGHYLYTRRRYKLTEEQAKRLVDDMWANQITESKVFYELFDRDKLIEHRLAADIQERIRQIIADFGA